MVDRRVRPNSFYCQLPDAVLHVGKARVDFRFSSISQAGVPGNQRKRYRNTATKNAQNLQFQTIIDELKEQLAASQTQLATSATQYQTTIAQVNQTLKTTQKAANYANESVRALTGGDSYLEVDFTWPFWVNKPPPGEIGFTVKSAGKYPLWDVNVDWQEGDPLEACKKGIVRNSLSIGTVSNTYAKPLRTARFPDPAKDNVYWFWVFSRNQPSVVTIHI